jgi:Na+-transporting NADH:ubiquinone oxidoreductase subunit NqrF
MHQNIFFQFGEFYEALNSRVVFFLGGGGSSQLFCHVFDEMLALFSKNLSLVRFVQSIL